MDREDDDSDNQEECERKREIEKLNLKVFDLEAENAALKTQLKRKKYDEVYRENEMLQIQL